ncbi:laccase-1 [Aristolochia californica]|uniref:laccase-1 n=1 Tax=Aristolochia californica TaxID=171875 RepID=UPI0035E38D49
MQVEWKTETRLCHTKKLLIVNGMYPGPSISIYEGDEVEIKVTNRISDNTTLHWHGVRQMRTGWADGPAYITQCPIQSNRSYKYRFRVINQRGTLWWHAHLSWQRASVHGAFIIFPRVPYPFSTPIEAEIPIIFGEWWNGAVDAIEADTIMHGSGPNVSDAYTINGLPGPLYPCSVKDTFVQTVKHGKTYMIRLINAALNDELFFSIANHTLTVVEVDATYIKPFTTTSIMITPGQTTNVLLSADSPSKSGAFPMAVGPYATAMVPFDQTTAVGFITYDEYSKRDPKTLPASTSISLDFLPPMRDNRFATEFSNQLRSLGSSSFPCNVPKQVEKRFFLTISLNLQDCPPKKICKGLNGKRFSASINNQSFVRPPISVLQGYYKNMTTGALLRSDFPEKPLHPFDYTHPAADINMNPEFGSKLLMVPYGISLEFVLQDTGFINAENHPIHIHGHNFFVVGSGFGNFDADRDPANYNLIDPPERNTVAVPSGGWAALRLKADNPGVWFIHCHLEAHTTWGLAMAFIVKNGHEASQSILPPPEDLPLC